MEKLCMVLQVETAGAAGIDIRQTGKRIQKLCMGQGLTVKQIQKELDIGFQSIYAWFAGSALPSLENIYQLGWMLGIPIEQMIIGMHKKTRVWLHLHPDQTGEKRMKKRIWKYYTYGLSAADQEIFHI